MKTKFLILNLFLLMFFACSKEDDNSVGNQSNNPTASVSKPDVEEGKQVTDSNQEDEEEPIELSLKFPSQSNAMAQKQTKTASKVKQEEELYQVEYNTSEVFYVKLKNEEEAYVVRYQNNSLKKAEQSKLLFPNYVSCDNKWYKVTEIGDNEHSVFASNVTFDEIEIPETIVRINSNSIIIAAVVVFNAPTEVSNDVLLIIAEIVVENQEIKKEFEEVNKIELDKDPNQGSQEVQEEEKDYVDFGENFSVYWKKMNYGAISETDEGYFVKYEIANGLNIDGWRAPTKEEAEFLLSNATWTKQEDGINNNYIVSVGDVEIFLPATVIKKVDNLTNELVADSGYSSNYVKLWTSTQYPNMDNNYCIYCVNNPTVGTVSWERYIPVRLVKDKVKSE